MLSRKHVVVHDHNSMTPVALANVGGQHLTQHENASWTVLLDAQYSSQLTTVYKDTPPATAQDGLGPGSTSIG